MIADCEDCEVKIINDLRGRINSNVKLDIRQEFFHLLLQLLQILNCLLNISLEQAKAIAFHRANFLLVRLFLEAEAAHLREALNQAQHQAVKNSKALLGRRSIVLPAGQLSPNQYPSAHEWAGRPRASRRDKRPRRHNAAPNAWRIVKRFPAYARRVWLLLRAGAPAGCANPQDIRHIRSSSTRFNGLNVTNALQFCNR